MVKVISGPAAFDQTLQCNQRFMKRNNDMDFCPFAITMQEYKHSEREMFKLTAVI